VGDIVCTSCSPDKFADSFKKNAKRSSTGLLVQKPRRAAATGAMPSESKGFRHGLRGKGLLAQPIDGVLFLEAAGTFWQNQV
jgi:hypothetical protein